MKKPLFAEILEAEEYNYLYTDSDNMNYYSAKQYDDYYVLVDDYDNEVFTLSIDVKSAFVIFPTYFLNSSILFHT